MTDDVIKKSSPYRYWGTVKLNEHNQLIRAELLRRQEEEAAVARSETLSRVAQDPPSRVVIDIREHEPLDPDTVPGMYIVGNHHLPNWPLTWLDRFSLWWLGPRSTCR